MADADDHAAVREAAQALLTTRVASVFASMPAAAVTGWLGATLVVAAFWQDDIAMALLLWLAVLALIGGARILATAAFHHGFPRHWPPVRWAVLASILNGLTGVTCGIGSFWLTGIGQDYQITVLCCFVMALAIGSFASLAYWPAHGALCAPIFILLAAGFLRMDRPEAIPLALGTILVCLFVGVIARNLGRSVVLSMRLTIENQLLADRLRGHALALEQANHELTELSATDPLTGLANRRRFEAMLEVEWQRSMHTQRSIGLMIVDVDHFKAYNDRHGHTAGDDCLQLISDVLRRHVRYSIDLPARYGGGEFVIILPGADATAVEVIAERVRNGVAALHAAIPGVLRKVTVSIGVSAAVPQFRSAARGLVSAAEAAVREAKQAGRDRVHTTGMAA